MMLRIKAFVLVAVLAALLMLVVGVGAQDGPQPVAQIDAGGTIDGLIVNADGSLLLLVDGQPTQVAPDGSLSIMANGRGEDIQTRFGMIWDPAQRMSHTPSGVNITDFLAENDTGSDQVEGEIFAASPYGGMYVSVNAGNSILLLDPNGEIRGGWSATQATNGTHGGWAAMGDDEIKGSWSATQDPDDGVSGWEAIMSALPARDGSLFISTNDLSLARLLPDGTVQDLGLVTTAFDGEITTLDILATSPAGEVFVNINNFHYVFQSSDGRTYELYMTMEDDLGTLYAPDDSKTYEFYTTEGYSPRVLAAIGPNGDLFMNINNTHHVLQFNATGTLVNQIGGPDMFTEVTGLGVDVAGRLVVADRTGLINFFALD